MVMLRSDLFDINANRYMLRSKLKLLPVLLSLSYVLECASCGIIYRSRQYWMGNQDPENSVVRPEVKHVWLGVSISLRPPSRFPAGYSAPPGVSLGLGF